jgi:type IV pilus assembly protein PilC
MFNRGHGRYLRNPTKSFSENEKKLMSLLSNLFLKILRKLNLLSERQRSLSWRFTPARTATKINLSHFTRQLSTMLQAGVPLTRCFDILEQTQPSSAVRIELTKIRKQLLAGHTLHDSLQTTPQMFDRFTCQLIKLGEQTGKLDSMLASLAVHHDKRVSLHRKIRQALLYPCTILVTACLLTISMFVWVVPAFADLFHDVHQQLPLLTRSIFAISSLLNASLPYLLVFIILGIASCRVAHRRGKLAVVITRTLHAVPWLHAGMQTLALIKFTRNLGIALAAGIPILQALQLTASLTGNNDVTRAIHRLRYSVTTGISLHQSMEAHTVFTVLVRQMIKVGEESGSLDALLLKTADILETDLDARVHTLTQLLEPLIMCVLGVLIGGLVIGMYLPVFNLGSTL